MFFAEGLPKLGVVNLEIELSIPTDDSTSLSTSNTVSSAVLQHHNDTQIIRLPLPTSSTQFFTFRSNESIITARIPSAPSMDVTEPMPLLSAEDIRNLWSSGGRLSCSACQKPLVEKREMKWKDLPSESWQDYADHWFCHRHTHSHSPLQSHPHTDAHDLLPIPVVNTTAGTALVGVTSLLVHSDDTLNLSKKVFTHIFPVSWT